MAVQELAPIGDDSSAAPGWIDQPIQGKPEGKNLLSIDQLEAGDIYDYLDEAKVADEIINDKTRRGIAVAPFAILIALMKQPSTRTGGSMITAMQKLGGNGQLYNDFSNTSEAKGETEEDGWLAFAAQADILGIRTKEPEGPYNAAQAIATSFNNGKLPRFVPVLNLGNGKDEHPTQALGDMYTISEKFNEFTGLTVGVVGDHLNYRAFHSLMKAAAKVGMQVIAVESEAAPVPAHLVEELGPSLERTNDLDATLKEVDVLYMGRRPDEYTGSDPESITRSKQLEHDYATWVVDRERAQLMRPNGIIKHPRPRRNELHVSVDGDPRAYDVIQMGNMIPARMAIIARHLGLSIKDSVKPLHLVS